jgi:hypothetical protein
MLTFAERTMTVTVDTAACEECGSKACVAACETYSRGMLRLEGGRPSVAHLSEDEVRRQGTECLACEHACRLRGRGALSILVPIEGLDAYLAGRGA